MTAVERYLAPKSLAEATCALAEGPASMFAGGTDRLVQTRTGRTGLHPLLVNLRHVEDIAGIDEAGGRIRIGALVTITEVLESELLRARARVLVDAADCFGCGQVRNMATLGGNICTASPAGDMIIPLLLMDAGVELASWSDGTVVRRTMPLDAFFVGPGMTRLRPGEILTGVDVPVPEPGSVGLFRKFGTRPAMDVAVASVGIAGVTENGGLHRARVAFGAVAPTPIRGPRTEAALEGATLDGPCIARIARIAEEEVAPISDVRASAWYRRRIIHELTRGLLHDVG